jgi:hypothetical protein
MLRRVRLLLHARTHRCNGAPPPILSVPRPRGWARRFGCRGERTTIRAPRGCLRSCRARSPFHAVFRPEVLVADPRFRGGTRCRAAASPPCRRPPGARATPRSRPSTARSDRPETGHGFLRALDEEAALTALRWGVWFTALRSTAASSGEPLAPASALTTAGSADPAFLFWALRHLLWPPLAGRQGSAPWLWTSRFTPCTVLGSRSASPCTR